MQMINKNRDGVTLLILVLTIIVLTIIVSITVDYGLSEIHSVSNKKTELELTIVQEAIMQRYTLVKSANQLGIIAKPITTDKSFASDTSDEINEDQKRPEGFVGTRIANPKASITDQGFSSVILDSKYNLGDSELPYEKYYYLLDENDLLELGIEKGDESKFSDEVDDIERKYIVNYLTGEIFDIANKKYYKVEDLEEDEVPVYTQPTKINMEKKTYDFNDD